jgi:hypothetical protein
MRATAAKATTNTTVRTRLETRRCLVIEVVLTESILQVEEGKKVEEVEEVGKSKFKKWVRGKL